jgi:serine/threonine protein kinase
MADFKDDPESQQPDDHGAVSLPDMETVSSASSSNSLFQIHGYKIFRVIGSGGMGVVYEAEQQNPKRLVALKVIRSGQFVDEYHVRLFEREAQALARLKHPGIAAIYESGRTSDGQHYFAMELIRGDTLEAYLEKTKEAGALTPARLRERLEIFRKISDAINYAHQRGVIHRDLKPSNIIIHHEFDSAASHAESHMPGIKILDFGLARITWTLLPQSSGLRTPRDWRNGTPKLKTCSVKHYRHRYGYSALIMRMYWLLKSRSPKCFTRQGVLMKPNTSGVTRSPGCSEHSVRIIPIRRIATRALLLLKYITDVMTRPCVYFSRQYAPIRSGAPG